MSIPIQSAASPAPSAASCLQAGYSSGWCEESFGVTLVAVLLFDQVVLRRVPALKAAFESVD